MKTATLNKMTESVGLTQREKTVTVTVTNKNHRHYDAHPVCIIHFVSILINQNVFDDIIVDNV